MEYGMIIILNKMNFKSKDGKKDNISKTKK